MSGAQNSLQGQNAARIKILHEPSAVEPFVVLSKPAGLPSAPLVPGGESALTECARLFPLVLNVRGKKTVEGGLLHRIDTATSGLLLVAASQEFYDHIMAAQERGAFAKGYRALCDIDADNARALGGFPDAAEALRAQIGASQKSGDPSRAALDFFQGQNAAALEGLELASYFRPYGKGKKEVRPVLQSSNAAALKKLGSKKLYSTKIVSVKAAGDDAVLVECKIAQGFRHQVRAHLAWLGLPIKGDALYNARFAQGQKARAGAFCGEDAGSHGEEAALQGGMRFEAASLEFPRLIGDKIFRFELD